MLRPCVHFTVYRILFEFYKVKSCLHDLNMKLEQLSLKRNNIFCGLYFHDIFYIVIRCTFRKCIKSLLIVTPKFLIFIFNLSKKIMIKIRNWNFKGVTMITWFCLFTYIIIYPKFFYQLTPKILSRRQSCKWE